MAVKRIEQWYIKATSVNNGNGYFMTPKVQIAP